MMELASMCERGAQAAEGAQKKASNAQQKYVEEKKRSQALLEETERLAEALESKTQDLARLASVASTSTTLPLRSPFGYAGGLTNEEGLQNEVIEGRRQIKELNAKVQRLEGQLSRAHVAEQEAIRSSANAKGVNNVVLQAMSDGQVVPGGVAGIIAGVLQDVELGEKAGVTLVDLGLSDFAVLSPLDRFLQLLSALMTVRADARLAVFGVWVLCHLIYVIYLVYAHFT